MPELPEVEVVKRSLLKRVKNSIIKKVKVNDSKLRYKISKNEIKTIIGKKVKKVTRRSKFLIFEFDQKILMLVHLGMTGKFFYIDKKQKFKTSFYYDLNDKDHKHDRVIFFLSKNKKLIYNDTRKFGFIRFYNLTNIKNIPHIKRLGPEPLNQNFNFNYFKTYILNRNLNIKNILMDQKFVSGLGNIYVNEILFYSCIKPNRKVKKLNDTDIRKIITNTKKILKSAIDRGGSSIRDFSSENGKKGSFQEHLKVYGRIGLSCSNSDCKKIIKKMVISNRSTFYCPSCQKY